MTCTFILMFWTMFVCCVQKGQPGIETEMWAALSGANRTPPPTPAGKPFKVDISLLLFQLVGIVQLFPFDEQNCTITFGSWNYESKFLELVPEPEPDLHNYYDNQEWVLRRASVEPALLETVRAGNFSVVLLRMEIARQPFYYIFNLIIPVTFITLTSILGMHAPTPHGTPRSSRAQLGIVTLLPMGVALLSIVGDLPRFSLRTEEGRRGSFSGVPLLGMFYLALLLTISLVTTTQSFFVWLDRLAYEGRRIPCLLCPLAPAGESRCKRNTSVQRILEVRLSAGQPITACQPEPCTPSTADADADTHHQTHAWDSMEAWRWELLIRRLEWASLLAHLGLVGLWVLLFVHHDWRDDGVRN